VRGIIASQNNKQKLEVEISPYGFSMCEIKKSIRNARIDPFDIITALLIQKLEGSVCPPPTQAVLLYYGNNQPKNEPATFAADSRPSILLRYYSRRFIHTIQTCGDLVHPIL
jgi:hypothetical protein